MSDCLMPSITFAQVCIICDQFIPNFTETWTGSGTCYRNREYILPWSVKNPVTKVWH